MTAPPKNRDALREMIARAINPHAFDGSKPKWPRAMRQREALQVADIVISAIDDARVEMVPGEPTKEMLNAAEEMYMPFGEMIAAWDGFMRENPLRKVTP